MKEDRWAESRIKRRTVWFCAIAFFLCAGMLTGVLYVYNEIFPIAKPIQLPKTEDVLSASVYRSADKTAVPITTEHLQKLFTAFQNAEPTRKQALNDTPTVRPYYAVEVKTADRICLYFVYLDNGLGYIEMPYEGIYEINPAILDLVAWNAPTE